MSDPPKTLSSRFQTLSLLQPAPYPGKRRESGRDGLPAAFRNAMMISKPFDPNQLVTAVRGLLDRSQRSSAEVVPLKPKR